MKETGPTLQVRSIPGCFCRVSGFLDWGIWLRFKPKYSNRGWSCWYSSRRDVTLKTSRAWGKCSGRCIYWNGREESHLRLRRYCDGWVRSLFIYGCCNDNPLAYFREICLSHKFSQATTPQQTKKTPLLQYPNTPTTTSVDSPIYLYPYLSYHCSDVVFHAKTQQSSFLEPKWWFYTLSFAFREGRFFTVFITVIFWFKVGILVFIEEGGPWFGAFRIVDEVRFGGFGWFVWITVVGWEWFWFFGCFTLGLIEV